MSQTLFIKYTYLLDSLLLTKIGLKAEELKQKETKGNKEISHNKMKSFESLEMASP